MNKITQIILFIGIIAVGFSAIIYINGLKSNLGNLNVNDNAYSSSATYSTSTLTNGVATLLVQKATTTRTYVKVCNPSGTDVLAWIYKVSTSTNVVVNKGTPIFASSTTAYPQIDACMTINENDPYLGQVWGIVNSTTTLTIESVQE